MDTADPYKIKLTTVLGCVGWVVGWVWFNWQLIAWLPLIWR